MKRIDEHCRRACTACHDSVQYGLRISGKHFRALQAALEERTIPPFRHQPRHPPQRLISYCPSFHLAGRSKDSQVVHQQPASSVTCCSCLVILSPASSSLSFSPQLLTLLLRFPRTPRPLHLWHAQHLDFLFLFLSYIFLLSSSSSSSPTPAPQPLLTPRTNPQTAPSTPQQQPSPASPAHPHTAVSHFQP